MDVTTLKSVIDKAPGIMVYFKNEQCGPCQVLRPQVEELVKKEFPQLEFQIVDTLENPLLTGEFNVYSNPTILVYFDGKEYLRKSKYIGISELENDIRRIYEMAF